MSYDPHPYRPAPADDGVSLPRWAWAAMAIAAGLITGVIGMAERHQCPAVPNQTQHPDPKIDPLVRWVATDRAGRAFYGATPAEAEQMRDDYNRPQQRRRS